MSEKTHRDQFQQLYDESRDRIWTLCLRMLGREDLAREAFQECFIRAWRALPEFRGESKASTWLWSIAIRSALEQQRREKRHQHVEMDEERLPMPQPTSDLVERDDMENFLLAALSPKQRALIHLRYTQELSYDEIAQSMGISLSAVKVGLHRAKAVMKEHLQRTHGGREVAGEGSC